MRLNGQRAGSSPTSFAFSMSKSIQALFTTLVASATLFASTGCISSRETVYNDVDRTPVSFASDKAGHTFYEALTYGASRRGQTEKHVGVNLILIDVEQTTVSGPNKTFNQAVAFADTNRDGTITESEATIFAQAWPSRKG